MSTVPKNTNQVKSDKEHGGFDDYLKPVDFIKKINKKRLNAEGSKGKKTRRLKNSRRDRKDQKTGVDLRRPEKPPNRVVTQPNLKDFKRRSGFLESNKILLTNQSGESLRKLRSRIETLSRSKSQIQGRCNPLYYLRRFFKHKIVEKANRWELQKISNFLVDGLVFSSHPVGIYLSENIQLVVASTNPTFVKRLVSCLPFWPTSYTMPVLRNIVFILKKVYARHRTMRL